MNAAVARLLPRSWRAVAWVDAEVIFENDGWAVDTLRALTAGHLDALQPFSHFVMFDGTYSMRSIAAEIASGGHFQRTRFGDAAEKGHFGLACAMTRRTYDKFGGLFPVAILGGGDVVIAAALFQNMSFFKPFLPPHAHMHERWYAAVHQYVGKAAAPPPRIGFVVGGIRHADHGSHADRRYETRFRIIEGFNPEKHLVINADGLPVPSDAMPASIRDAVREYFSLRREDA